MKIVPPTPAQTPVATACSTCHRAVWTKDVDKDGNCIGCAEAPHKPTEREMADLGRPAEEGDTD